MLKVNNVCKSYGGQKVLNDVNLVVQKNQIVGLAGPSGGGKSTLLRCIQKLEQVDAGTVLCEGNTGFMFQDFQLFSHMTVLENLLYAPCHQNRRQRKDNALSVRLSKCERSKRYKKEALGLLKTLGLMDKMNVFPQKLSGGQKQRVALARSLMMQPALLLCDEPTSGLDVATTLSVVSLLKSVRKLGVTMVVASHDLDFLTKVADTIFLLKEGQVVVELSDAHIFLSQ